MSSVIPGDRDLHYSDNSHRWIAPPDVHQHDWDAVLRIHLDAHRYGSRDPEEAVAPVRRSRLRHVEEASQEQAAA